MLEPVRYHQCPRCFRAISASLGEAFCPNDGRSLLKACPGCAAPIRTPYARYCVKCGLNFGQLVTGSRDTAIRRSV